jgi:hypothetical protein
MRGLPANRLSAAARSVRHGVAYSLGMSLYCLTYAHLACLNSVKSAIVREDFIEGAATCHGMGQVCFWR